MASSSACCASDSGMACFGLFGEGFLNASGDESGTGTGLCAYISKTSGSESIRRSEHCTATYVSSSFGEMKTGGCLMILYARYDSRLVDMLIDDAVAGEGLADKGLGTAAAAARSNPPIVSINPRTFDRPGALAV